MNSIDVNYILDGQVQLFDYIFFSKVGIDGDKNYVYLVQDKFRDNRYAKFVVVNDPAKIREVMTPLLIYQNSNQSKLIQPIYDFTVSKEKNMILVTMPVPPKTLYSVIKDPKINLRVRLFLVQNLANGGVYMHNRRRFVFGHIRPQSIAIHQQLNVFQRGKSSKKYPNSISEPIQLYARLNSFSTLIETQTKAQKWKWMNTELQYYDAPQIWSEIDKKRGPQIKMHSNQSQKSVQPSRQYKYTQKSDVWALGLVMVEILTAMRIHQLLGSRDVVPGRFLKQLTMKQKLLKSQAKASQSSENQKAPTYYKKTQQFYEKLLKNIECFPIRSILERMLAYRPERRPTIQQVLLIVERLQVIDKRNKNLGRITSYRRSLKNLKQSIQDKQKSQQKQDPQNFDDKKSVVSMKSVRSGKSNRSHLSQSRKRIPSDFTAILYARQQISEIHTMPTNPMYRTYFEDCKNRLPIDVNFTPPPKRFIMRKDDKAIVLALKGENDEDIKKWNIQKAIGNSLNSYEDRVLQGINIRQTNVTTFIQSKNISVEAEKHGPTRRFELWLHNLRQQQQEKRKMQLKNSTFSPTFKKVPHNTATMRQFGYNDNLCNYHFLGVQHNKQNLSLQTCLFRKQITTSAEFPEKFPQFTLNLRSLGLQSIPTSLAEYLQPPNCLKYLCLARNSITSMKSLILSVNLCENLMILDLTNNNIKQIDVDMWKLKCLEQCYLGNNQITIMKGFDQEDKQEQDFAQITCQIQKPDLIQANRMNQEEKKDSKISPAYRQEAIQNQSNLNIMKNQLNQQQVDLNVGQDREEAKQDSQKMNDQKDKEVMQAFGNDNCRKACLKLRKLYLNSNRIKYIQNVFSLPALQVLALGKNPLAQNLTNIEAFTILRNKNIKIYY